MKRFILIGLLLALTGCGESGGDGGARGPQSLEGVWIGSRTYTVYLCLIICAAHHKVTTPAMALATSDGTIHLLPWDVVNSPSGFSPTMAGKVQVKGNALSGTLRRRCDPLGGPPLFDHVAVEGSVAKRVALDIEYEEDKCIGRGTFNLDFDRASDQSASLAIVSGQWSSANYVLNVGDDGAYNGANGTGCQLSGFITTASASVNIYKIDMNVNCASFDTSYHGLATVLPDQHGTETLVISGLGINNTKTVIVKR